MHRILDLIDNLGGMFSHISLIPGKVCKFVLKKVKETLTLILTHSTGDDLIDYKIYGNSTQRNYTSKNLFDENTIYSSITKTGDVFSDNASAVNNIKYYIPQELVGKTLTFSAYLKTVTTTNLRVGFNGTFNGNLINNAADFGRSVITFTPTATTEYINITYGNGPDTIYFKDMQLEVGSTATTYEPYLVTPSPETPSEVISLGEDGEVNVVTSGKNLFNINKLWSDGTQILRSPEQARALTIPVPNGTYTISTNCPNNTTPTVATILVGNGQNSLNAFTSSANGVFLNIPKTIVVDTGYLEIGIRNVSPNYLVYDEASWNSSGNWIQAEEGTVATDYEPYQGEPVTTVIDLTGHEPLRKLDDLSDYIDYENGKIIRNIGKLVLDGTNSIPIQENPFFVDAKGYRLTISNYASSNKKPMSNYFVGVSNNKNLTDNCIVGASYVNIVMSYAENINTVAEFKSWLASKYAEGNPVIVYYALNTPVEEDITLPTIPTVEGTTYLEVNNKPTASNFYAKYYGNE